MDGGQSNPRVVFESRADRSRSGTLAINEHPVKPSLPMGSRELDAIYDASLLRRARTSGPRARPNDLATGYLL